MKEILKIYTEEFNDCKRNSVAGIINFYCFYFKNLLKDFIKEYNNNNYEDYYMDIQRYNITYNIIVYDNLLFLENFN